MLEHCYNGTNFFTGEIGVRLDFIALHKKVRSLEEPVQISYIVSVSPVTIIPIIHAENVHMAVK